MLLLQHQTRDLKGRSDSTKQAIVSQILPQILPQIIVEKLPHGIPGTTPLTGERAQATFRGRPRGRLGRVGSGKGWRLRTSSRSFWEGLISERCFPTSPHAFGFNPSRGRDLIVKQFRDAPDMSGEPSRHCRCARMPTMIGGTQLLIGKAKIGGTYDHIHSRLDGLQTMSRMPTFAREASQALPHGPIEPESNGGV